MRHGVRRSVLVLRGLHIAIRIFLVLACAFWSLIALEIFPALFVQGLDGARTRLVHIWSMGKVQPQWSCQDSLQLLHEGYTDLILLVLLTWVLLEVKRFLDRRIAANAGIQFIPTPPVERDLNALR